MNTSNLSGGLLFLFPNNSNHVEVFIYLSFHFEGKGRGTNICSVPRPNFVFLTFSLPCNQIINLYESNNHHISNPVFIRCCDACIVSWPLPLANKRNLKRLFSNIIKESQSISTSRLFIAQRTHSPAYTTAQTLQPP